MAGLGKKLYYAPKPTRWSKGIGLSLPEEYKKFWKEWKLQQPSPVHYIPKEGKYEKLKNGSIVPVQNVPLLLKYPKEIDDGIWGGEAVVQGFYKSSRYTRRTVRYWVPELKKSVVYSEILNKYMRMIVTNRTLQLIHEHYGFDHYILKTPACDLRSLLALKLKREMLLSLANKTLYSDNLDKQNEIYTKYEHYLKQYTTMEIEWYGLSYKEACSKYKNLRGKDYEPVPLKVKFREELIKQLEDEKLITEGSQNESQESWISKLNPFSNRSTSNSSTA